MSADRRQFLKQAAALAGGAGMLHFFPESLARAIAIDPAAGSSFLDAEHIVFLMQENRSFDHTYGSLQGVRGFEDPRVVKRADGYPVWLQQDGKGNSYVPFRMDIHNTKATWMSSLPHSWENQVDARNDGHYDRWLEVKRPGNPEYQDMPLTLGYYNREDIPYYYALADAFTVCDQNFCSSLTGTTPNRLYFWTGTIRDKDEAASMARVWNGDADYDRMPAWKSFPERLSEEGIEWKIYQNEISAGVGFEGEEDSWLANFTDNPIEFFEQYNVRLTPEYRAALPKVEQQIIAGIADTEKKLKALHEAGKDDATDDGALRERKELENRLEWLRKRLVINKEEQRTCTQEAWDKLSPAQKDIHTRAFTNNRNDPHFHALEDYTYTDNGSTKTMKVPKGDVLHQFRTDVQNGQLPTVSWLVPPENFSDHPSAAWYGAWYISEVMDILTKNPEIWKKTIFVLTYDENDGYFDHGAPFVAPHPKDKNTGFCSAGIPTDVEFVQNKEQQSSEPDDMRISPIGLGFRVPMVIASPWSRGGYVNSQVFDHTSSLQLLEQVLSKKTGKKIHEPRISDWRRTVCGDLSSVFREPGKDKQQSLKPIEQKQFLAGIHQAQFKPAPGNFAKVAGVKAGAKPSPEQLGQIQQQMPRQEPGSRPSSALPYQLEMNMARVNSQLNLDMFAGASKFGKRSAGAPFTVYARGSYQGQPNPSRNYAVRAGDQLQDTWSVDGFGKDRSYELEAYGPNGFYRRFMGTAQDQQIHVMVNQTENRKATLQLSLHNTSKEKQLVIIDQPSYGGKRQEISLEPEAKNTVTIDLKNSRGWYDVQVRAQGSSGFFQHYAGRVETGETSITDPLIGRS